MKKAMVLAMTGVILSLFVFSCSSATSSDSSTPAYVGTWKYSDASFNYTLVLTESSFTYTDTAISGGQVADNASGSVAVSGSTITFTVTATDTGETSNSSTWAVSGSTLTLTGGNFSHTYTKS